jgi:predicted ester cyclase
VKGVSEGPVTAANGAMIERSYHGLWNVRNLAVADEIVASDARFRVSLGSTPEGLDAFKGYVEKVRAAFPDRHNRVDETVACDDKVVARLTLSGTAGTDSWTSNQRGSYLPSIGWEDRGRVGRRG